MPPRYALSLEETAEMRRKGELVTTWKATFISDDQVNTVTIPMEIAQAIVDTWKCLYEQRNVPIELPVRTYVVRACCQVYGTLFRPIAGYEHATDLISVQYPFLEEEERAKMNDLIDKIEFNNKSANPSKHTFGPATMNGFERLYFIGLSPLFGRHNLKSSIMNRWARLNADLIWFVSPKQLPAMIPLLEAHKAGLARRDITDDSSMPLEVESVSETTSVPETIEQATTVLLASASATPPTPPTPPTPDALPLIASMRQLFNSLIEPLTIDEPPAPVVVPALALAAGSAAVAAFASSLTQSPVMTARSNSTIYPFIIDDVDEEGASGRSRKRRRRQSEANEQQYRCERQTYHIQDLQQGLHDLQACLNKWENKSRVQQLEDQAEQLRQDAISLANENTTLQAQLEAKTAQAMQTAERLAAIQRLLE